VFQTARIINECLTPKVLLARRSRARIIIIIIMRAIAAVYLHLYETAVLFMDHFARAKRAKKWLILYRHRSLYINISIIIVIVVRSGGVVNSGSYRKSPRAFSTPRNGKKKNSGIGMCWFQRPRQRNRQEQRERERERALCHANFRMQIPSRCRNNIVDVLIRNGLFSIIGNN